nr:MAG TPA: dUTPase [Caudoviricetes sp.]
MKIVLEPWAIMPTRAHEFDAGLDLYSADDDTYIYPRSSELFDTGVHIQLPKNTVGFLKSKSGLNVKSGITSEGVIDVGYTGSIMVKLYNHSDKPYRVRKGDKISQLVILPCLLPELEVVDSLEDTERGTGGFGSTGR